MTSSKFTPCDSLDSSEEMKVPGSYLTCEKKRVMSDDILSAPALPPGQLPLSLNGYSPMRSNILLTL